MAEPEQFSLFAPHVEHGRAAEERALALDFRRAALCAEAAGGMAGPLLGLCAKLAAVKPGRGKLAAFHLRKAQLDTDGIGLIPGLEEALAAAAALELEAVLGEGAEHEGCSSGLLWRRAGQRDRGLKAWAVAAERTGRASDWIRLANDHHVAGEIEAARDAYAHAFDRDATGVETDHIADVAVVDLVDLAGDLVPEGEGDPRLWTLAVGLLEGVFRPRWGRGTSVPDVMALTATPAERAKAATAVLVHAWHDKDPVPARRALKQHAEWLLPRLMRTRF